MRAKEFLRENAVELYHGTLRTNVQSILANGLNPTVGEFTKSIYANKAKPLVFAADIKGSRAVYCALQSQIGMKLGKFPPTAEEIAQHGALLVISRDVNKFKQYNAKRRQGSKEPTDYTSQRTVHIDNVITGKDLLRWIKTHNADWGEMSCPTDVRQDIAEAPLPPDWDPEKIDLKQTFRDRIQYVVDRARRIGGGSARVAFDIDYQGRPTVIKVAKNRKGLIQNKAEIDVYLKNKGRWGANRLVVPLVDYDQENSPPVWIQTERARRIQAPTLLRLLHAPDWWTFLKLVAHYRGLIKPDQMMYFKTPEDIEDDYIAKGGSEKDWKIFSGYARDLANLVKATTVEDYGHVGNWGEYQGRPVLLDLGFTDESKAAYGFKE